MDREKVVKGLELCEIGSDDKCYETECPYYMQGCTESLKNDILELLKEHKAKNGYWINPTSQDCRCSECGEQPVHEPGESVPLYDYCPYCGAKMEVKWSE